MWAIRQNGGGRSIAGVVACAILVQLPWWVTSFLVFIVVPGPVTGFLSHAQTCLDELGGSTKVFQRRLEVWCCCWIFFMYDVLSFLASLYNYLWRSWCSSFELRALVHVTVLVLASNFFREAAWKSLLVVLFEVNKYSPSRRALWQLMVTWRWYACTGTCSSLLCCCL